MKHLATTATHTKKNKTKRKGNDSEKKSKSSDENKFLMRAVRMESHTQHNRLPHNQNKKSDFRKYKTGYKFGSSNANKEGSWKNRSNQNREELHAFIENKTKSSMQSAMKEFVNKKKSPKVGDEQFNYEFRKS